jgi:hypothetical protein
MLSNLVLDRRDRRNIAILLVQALHAKLLLVLDTICELPPMQVIGLPHDWHVVN